MTSAGTFYHIGFGRKDLGEPMPTIALLSGDPSRTRKIGETMLSDTRTLSDNRGLYSCVGSAPDGRRIVCATSGMGAPSLSVVVNELFQVGMTTIIRIGTSGSIQQKIPPGYVVVTSAALCRQGAANDIAPVEYPAAADPFVTVALVEAARRLGVAHAVGITASVDTFFEGQERVLTSGNPHLLRSLRGITEEYRNLNVLNFEMEAGTLFKMASVYGFRAGCVCGIIAQRTEGESVVADAKGAAVDTAIRVALAAVGSIE